MKLWLAPLHGITYYYFRNTFLRHFSGIDAIITPFVPIQETNKLNVGKWLDFHSENNPFCDIIPQLMGNIPAHFTDTIRALQDRYGFTQFNWNIGCPMNAIVRKQRGCGIMPFPDKIEAVVEEVFSKTNCKFSLKMRLGLENRDEAYQIIERLAPYPIDFWVIHPRLGIEQYAYTVDLENFAKLLTITNTSIVYSGDILTPNDVLILQERFPQIDNIMLGRGILKNPFLAEQIQKKSSSAAAEEDWKIRFYNFYKDLASTYLSIKPESATLANFKELWHYFSILYKLTPLQLQQLLRIKSWDDFFAKTLEIIVSEHV